jgi:hypothetical protein
MVAKIPITAKLSAETLVSLEIQAKERGLTRSGAIAAAIEAWLNPAPTIGEPATKPALVGTMAEIKEIESRLSAIKARMAAPSPPSTAQGLTFNFVLSGEPR